MLVMSMVYLKIVFDAIIKPQPQEDRRHEDEANEAQRKAEAQT